MNGKSMNRRVFLAAAASAAVVPAALSSMAGASASGAANPFGSSTGEHRGRIYKTLKFSMFREKLPIAESFKILKDVGFEGVELSGPGGYDIKEVLAARDSTGLMIPGLIHASHWRTRFSDPDASVRAKAVADLEQALHDAYVLGASTVLVVVGRVSDPETENHEQVWKRSMTEIRKCIPTASRLGVRIGLENVWNGFCEDVEQWVKYCDEYASAWVGAYFDIGNHIKFGPPAQWIRALGSRIIKLDVKDWSHAAEAAGERRGFVPILQGDADWPAVRKALTEIGYSGWASAEVAGGDRHAMREISQQMDVALGL